MVPSGEEHAPRVDEGRAEVGLARLGGDGEPVGGAPVSRARATAEPVSLLRVAHEDAEAALLVGSTEPDDADHARAMLTSLSGRVHRVLTAVAVWDGRRSGQATSISRVWFDTLDADTIANYIASGEPFGKAGAYAIQSAMAGWIPRVEGSYSGIMGLPLHETARLLRRAGVRFPFRLASTGAAPGPASACKTS
jgi:septum formation protein